jgi:hypothetical protein
MVTAKHAFIHSFIAAAKKKRIKGGKAYSKGPQQQHQQQQQPHENARKRVLTADEDDARTIEHGARSHGGSRSNCSSSEPSITYNSGKLQEHRRSNQVSISSKSAILSQASTRKTTTATTTTTTTATSRQYVVLSFHEKNNSNM